MSSGLLSQAFPGRPVLDDAGIANIQELQLEDHKYLVNYAQYEFGELVQDDSLPNSTSRYTPHREVSCCFQLKV